MKYCCTFLLTFIICMNAFSQDSNSKDLYTVPDSIKATGFYAEVKISDSKRSTKKIAGIVADKAVVSLGYSNGQKVIHFNFTGKAKKDVGYGKNVYPIGKGNGWNYDWKDNETYPLLVLTASDSSTHKTLYSGYIFLPEEKKWKLIAARKYDDTTGVKYISTQGNKRYVATYGNRWLQRRNGTWKALDSQTTSPPMLRHMSNIDSLDRQTLEEEMLRRKLPNDSVSYEDGVFYQTIKEGTGRLVKVSDTLTVHYKGSLFGDGSIFDQTKQKPATFPLERLIKGWQLGLVHCKVGGKMRLYITSGSAYGIRTRSANIPPNSILVFDIEVLDAKEKVEKQQ